MNPEYEERLKGKYEELFGKKVKSVQERFVFNFVKGGHSIHAQKKLNRQLRKAIEEYLQVISL